MIIGVRKWAVLVGLAMVAAGFLGALAGSWVPGPAICKDQTFQMGAWGTTAATCDEGAKGEIVRELGMVLTKCTCPSKETP